MHDAEALLSAIRRKCLQCSGNSKKEVDRCPVSDCPLYEMRKPIVKQRRTKGIAGQIRMNEIDETERMGAYG